MLLEVNWIIARKPGGEVEILIIPKFFFNKEQFLRVEWKKKNKGSFIASGFLTASHRNLHGNYGLNDQIEAIRWIRANAPNFGGNLNNIVVGGLGSGAACASILAVSPKTKSNFS